MVQKKIKMYLSFCSSIFHDFYKVKYNNNTQWTEVTGLLDYQYIMHNFRKFILKG